MRFFVIGASGLVGGNFVKHLKEEGHEVIGTHTTLETPDTVYFNALDLNDPKNFDLSEFQPQAIVHCAALAHVDHCEEHVQESYDLTVHSALNVLQLCKRYNSRLIYTSTDYVFDGKNGPYVEADQVHPLSVYGQHKLEVEHHIEQWMADRSIVLRIGNVYGDELRGKNFIIRIINDVKNGREWHMNLPVDQYATPVWAYDVARVGVRLATDGKAGLYHVGSTDFMNRIQLAQKVLSYLPGHRCSMTPMLTKDLGQKAARPLMSGLLASKFLSEYPDFRFHNVDDYMKQKLAEG